MDELISAAMVGSQRRSASLQDPLFQKVPGTLEVQLLGAAALAGIASLAGQKPLTAETLVADPEPDLRRQAPSRHLQWILDDHRDLLPEWLRLAQQSQRRPDPAYLPRLLEVGRSERSLWPLLAEVCGPRGRWLAGQNPDWAYLQGQGELDPSLWETGQSTLRLEWFRQFRQAQPEAARDLLKQSFSKESADDRSKFLQTFLHGLSLADEPFLEEALDDRSKGVRAQAAALLARLPQSGLAQRAWARVSTWIVEKQVSQWMGLRKALALEVNLPGECTPAMQRDGIEPKSPHRELGERAWWLQQCLAQAPLEGWRAAPAELLQAATQGDWAKVLIQGWSQACIAQQNLPWAEAMIDKGVENDGLFAMLPLARQEELLIQQMRPDWLLLHDSKDGLYSPKLSAVLLPWLQKHPTQDYDWSWSKLLAEVARRLPPTPETQVEEGWSPKSLGHASVEKLISTVKFRQSMYEEMRS